MSYQCYWQVTSPCKEHRGNMNTEKKAKQSNTSLPTQLWPITMNKYRMLAWNYEELLTSGSHLLWKPNCVSQLHSQFWEVHAQSKTRVKSERRSICFMREMLGKEVERVRGARPQNHWEVERASRYFFEALGILESQRNWKKGSKNYR